MERRLTSAWLARQFSSISLRPVALSLSMLCSSLTTRTTDPSKVGRRGKSFQGLSSADNPLSFPSTQVHSASSSRLAFNGHVPIHSPTHVSTLLFFGYVFHPPSFSHTNSPHFTTTYQPSSRRMPSSTRWQTCSELSPFVVPPVRRTPSSRLMGSQRRTSELDARRSTSVRPRRGISSLTRSTARWNCIMLRRRCRRADCLKDALPRCLSSPSPSLCASLAATATCTITPSTGPNPFLNNSPA